jgi:cysteine desulfurase
MSDSKIYLDNNSTTMVDPRVLQAMEPFFTRQYGNPNSLHSFGTEVHPEMGIALDRLYKGIEASDKDDIIINGCATEGNNTVLKGIYFSSIRESQKKQIITTPVEHPSVANTCDFLETLGAEIIRLPLNSSGVVDPDTLKKLIDPDKTALVSIMWANNETGLINPMKELAGICRDNNVLFHTDAVQAIGKVPVSVKEVPVDYLTFSAHKFHGPKGIGGLYVRNGRSLPPLLHGGEQMGGFRAGTVNVAYFIGMGLAMELATEYLPYEETRVRALRDKLENALLAIPDTQIIGANALRTPNTILTSFKGIEGEAFIWDLNQKGIAASTGSACSSEDLEPNATFKAMSLDNNLAHTGVRFSLSRYTTEEEIDTAINVIESAVNRLRAISSVY